MVFCNCGNEAGFHCTACTPNYNLCLACISEHLAKNTNDCIKPLKAKQAGSNICDFCGSDKAVKLAVFESYSKKVCKICKYNAELCIDLKWSKIITKYSDLENLSIRKSALSQINKELEQIRSFSQVRVAAENLKQDMNKVIDAVFENKLKELNQVSNKVDNYVVKIGKEAAEQSLLKEFDLKTEGGQLLSKVIQGKPLSLSNIAPQILIPEIKDFQLMVDSFVSSLKIIERDALEKSVFLFTPGKNVLVKYSLEDLERTEYVFEKIWNFEASWVQLDSGELFFCGGNGRDHSEVLQVNLNERSIRILPSFGGRAGHSLVQIEKSIYVFGGTKGSTTEKFLLNEERWLSLASIPVKIPRATSCSTKDGILVTGGDTDKIFIYNIEKDFYGTIEFPLEGMKVKNKIVFEYDNKLYCLTGDKVIVSKNGTKAKNEEYIVTDRDWWTYSAPVIHNGCAYFIKYFVRNLWCLSLETFKLTEITLK